MRLDAVAARLGVNLSPLTAQAEPRMSNLRLLLGFDYGTRQIGSRRPDDTWPSSRNSACSRHKTAYPDWQQIEALLKEWQPGRPGRRPAAEHGRLAQRNERARRKIRPVPARPLSTARTPTTSASTTYEAKGQRLAQGQRGGYRERPVDAIAAALLLQGWLEQHGA